MVPELEIEVGIESVSLDFKYFSSQYTGKKIFLIYWRMFTVLRSPCDLSNNL